MLVYIIEDERHAEPQPGEYRTLAEAVAELRRRASISWDKPPNAPPCTGWERCGRRYEVVECDTSTTPWRELSRVPYLAMSAAGVRWLVDPPGPPAAE